MENGKNNYLYKMDLGHYEILYKIQLKDNTLDISTILNENYLLLYNKEKTLFFNTKKGLIDGYINNNDSMLFPLNKKVIINNEEIIFSLNINKQIGLWIKNI